MPIISVTGGRGRRGGGGGAESAWKRETGEERGALVRWRARHGIEQGRPGIDEWA
jgi:hypothetical protein